MKQHIATLRALLGTATLTEKETHALKTLLRRLDWIELFVEDDATAGLYKSLGQYRSALLGLIRGEP